MPEQALGVLFSDRDWKSIWNRTSSEDVDLYVDAAAQHGVGVYFFRIRDIDLKARTVLAMTRTSNGEWQRKRVSLPKVVHNRAVHRINTTEGSLRALRSLGVIVYNYWNNFSKLSIYRKIRKSRALAQYLPDTCRFTQDDLGKYLRFQSFFVKPDRGSVGKGIIKVDSCAPGVWCATRHKDDVIVTDRVETRRLYSYLKRITGVRWCILQRSIDLLTHNGSPFDVRVSVQRDGTGRWQVTGMVGKVARKGSCLSNVYQGGRVMRLTDLFRGRPVTSSSAEKMLSKAALRIARHLARALPHLADVGFDFGIARNGRPYFIEMNCRDQRYSFRLAGMMTTFHRTYQNPIAYGKYLLSTSAIRRSLRVR